jgi:Tfp pilus assembly protein PilV
MYIQSHLKDEEGSTLIESLVAMTILVSVLLPASMFLGYVAASPQNEEKILALGIAQSEMEQVLGSRDYQNRSKIVDRKWTVQNRITKTENLVKIQIVVYRVNRTKPVIQLQTKRLFYDG